MLCLKWCRIHHKHRVQPSLHEQSSKITGKYASFHNTGFGSQKPYLQTTRKSHCLKNGLICCEFYQKSSRDHQLDLKVRTKTILEHQETSKSRYAPFWQFVGRFLRISLSSCFLEGFFNFATPLVDLAPVSVPDILDGQYSLDLRQRHDQFTEK